MVALFVLLPSGFLPDEDQGAIFATYSLPPGALLSRTVAIGEQIQHYFLTREKANVDSLFLVTGQSFSGTGQNQGQVFMHLTDWSRRSAARDRAKAIAERANGVFSQIRDAQVFVLVPPAVQSLGNSSGFDLELEDRAGLGHAALTAARDQLIGLAGKDPLLAETRPGGLEDAPQLHVDVDTARAGALGVSQGDINDTLSAAWGGSFINNFIDRGRVKQVYHAGRRALPRGSGGHRPLVRARRERGHGALLRLRHLALDHRPGAAGALQRRRLDGDPGQARRPARAPASAMDEIAKLVGKLPTRHRLRMDRPVLPGARGRAPRRRCSTASRSWSSSSAWRRSTRAGRSRWR